MKWSMLITLFLLSTTAWAGAAESGLDQLAQWMSGSLSSAAKAAEDSAYYDIRLEMAPICISPEGPKETAASASSGGPCTPPPK